MLGRAEHQWMHETAAQPGTTAQIQAPRAPEQPGRADRRQRPK
jgi:hypothetical protein